MKKFIALFLCFALLVPSALAEPSEADFFDFSICAEVYGIHDLLLKNADIRESASEYIAYSACWYLDSCRLIVTLDDDNNVNGAMIDGSGEQFLNACSAAITYLDEDHFTTNLGGFLFCYLMLLQKEPGEKEKNTLVDGNLFTLTKNETNYSFFVLKLK